MDAQEAGGDPDPREGPEHSARAEDWWPDPLRDGLSFRGCAFCAVSSAPRPLRAAARASVRLSPGLCRTLPAPRQRGDGRGRETASGELSPRPSGFPASDLGPPHTSPVGIWSVCPSLGLCRRGPTRLWGGGVSLEGFRGCSPRSGGRAHTRTPPRGCSEPPSHRRGAPGVCSPSSVCRRPCPVCPLPTLSSTGHSCTWSPAAFPALSALQTLAEGRGCCGGDTAQL